MPDATIISSAPEHARLTKRRWPRRALVLPAAATALAAVAAVSRRRIERPAAGPPASLSIASAPGGAAVLIDGKQVARTPATVPVAAGRHRVTLQRSDLMEASSLVNVGGGQTRQVHTVLWDRTATVVAVHPPFPGSAISNAAFLADGRIALDVTLPPGNDHQLWLRGRNSSLARIGPDDPAGPLAVTPDGRTVAYLMPTAPASPAQGWSTNGQRLTTVWTIAAAGDGARPRYALAPGAPSTELTDLAWAPNGQQLLLVGARQDATAGVRDELLWCDPESGTAQPLLDLPATVVPGSFLWSPGGDRVALLTQAGSLLSLCLLDVQDRSFRYLADLQAVAGTAQPFPPIAWSADGRRAVYAAAVPAAPTTLGGWLLGDHSEPGLFLTDTAGATSRRLGTGSADAPVWGADGTVLALVQSQGAATRSVATVDLASGRTTPVGTVPLTSGGAAAVRWDAAHAQALVIQQQNGAATYALATFGSEAAR